MRTNKLTIEMPLDGFTDSALDNLEKLIASKAGLIKKAVGADTLPIEKTAETLRFPWFKPRCFPDEAETYIQLIVALCEQAKKKKRVVAQETPAENEKFAFRLFLVHLGMIGAEYKNARRILLANLSGNTAFKDGGRRL
jgi:hypothetical protein